MVQRTAKENAAGLVFYVAVFNFPRSKKKKIITGQVPRFSS